MKTEDIVKLMLKSTDNNPYSGKLSSTDNLIEAINLAKLCKDFADKGLTDEAMDIDSKQWQEVINKLEYAQQFHQEEDYVLQDAYNDGFSDGKNTQDKQIVTDEKEKAIKEALNIIYKSEWEIIDRLNQHPEGLNFNDWLEKNKLKYFSQPVTDKKPLERITFDCKVCGQPFGDKLSLYHHYDQEHN